MRRDMAVHVTHTFSARRRLLQARNRWAGWMRWLLWLIAIFVAPAILAAYEANWIWLLVIAALWLVLAHGIDYSLGTTIHRTRQRRAKSKSLPRRISVAIGTSVVLAMVMGLQYVIHRFVL